MPGANRIAQVYGYAVCLVAVITFLIAATGLVEAMFRMSGGAGRSDVPDASLASFEAYKASKLLGPSPSGSLPEDQLLRALYEGDRARAAAQRAESQASRRRGATERLVKSLLLIALSVGLFAAHWKWTVKLRTADA